MRMRSAIRMIVVIGLALTAIVGPATQAGLASSPPLFTEHSAGQNRLPTSSAPLFTEHSAGQNRLASATAVSRQVVASSLDGGFDWRDAGIGAATAFASMSLFAGATLTIRRRRPLAH